VRWATDGRKAQGMSWGLGSKKFLWHMSGPHFGDHHLMLDEQAGELFTMTDPLAMRCRKLGGPTLRSSCHISRTKRGGSIRPRSAPGSCSRLRSTPATPAA